MPYEYKKKQDCRQKNGDKGTYVTKKKGASSQKCWKSKDAHDKSKAAQHVHELDEGPPSDPGPHPSAESASKTNKNPGPPPSVSRKKESVLRKFIRQILLQEQIGTDLEIKPSEIAGMGVFATNHIPKGTNLGLVHLQKPNGRYDVTDLGHMHNHSYEPNCINVKTGPERHLVTGRDIAPYEEITVDYTKQPDLEQPKEDWV